MTKDSERLFISGEPGEDFRLSFKDVMEIRDFERKEKSNLRRGNRKFFWPRTVKSIELEQPAGYVAYESDIREARIADLYRWMTKDSYNSWAIFGIPKYAWTVSVYGNWNHFSEAVCQDLISIRYGTGIFFWINIPENPEISFNGDLFTHSPEKLGPEAYVLDQKKLKDSKSLDYKVFDNISFQLAIVPQNPKDSLVERIQHFLYRNNRELTSSRASYILIEGPVDLKEEDVVTKPEKQVRFTSPVLVSEKGKLTFLHGGYREE